MYPFKLYDNVFCANMIKKWRKENSYTKARAGKKLGVCPTTLDRIEKYESIPSISAFRNIIIKLKLNPIQVFQILRVTPPGITITEMNAFIEKCKEEGRDPGLILAAFMRSYALTD